MFYLYMGMHFLTCCSKQLEWFDCDYLVRKPATLSFPGEKNTQVLKMNSPLQDVITLIRPRST